MQTVLSPIVATDSASDWRSTLLWRRKRTHGQDQLSHLNNDTRLGVCTRDLESTSSYLMHFWRRQQPPEPTHKAHQNPRADNRDYNRDHNHHPIMWRGRRRIGGRVGRRAGPRRAGWGGGMVTPNPPRRHLNPTQKPPQHPRAQP